MMKRIISLISLVLALAGVGFGAYAWHWEHRPHVLEIYCFALDKTGASPGNLAVFIRTPAGRTLLIDAGKSGSIITAISSVMPFYRRTIDTVISTNPDDSHITGLVSVVGRYRIGQVIEMSGTIATSSAYTAFESEISGQKIKHIEVSAGDQINLGDLALSANVLFPVSSSSPESNFEYSKMNQLVLALAIRYGSTTTLFGGDITKKEQAYLTTQISSSSDYSNSLLILPHAENTGASDESFFTALNPSTVVVLKNMASTKTSTKSKTKQQPAKTSKSKSKKPAKPAFNISAIADVSIINLTTDGDTEFVSNGTYFSEKKPR